MIKNFIILTLLLIFLLLKQVNSGHIYLWNHQVTYQENGKMNAVIKNIQLESGLDQLRYIYLKYPFNLGSSLKANLPIVYASVFGDKTKKKALVINPAGTNQYYLSFDLIFEIKKWYTIEIQVTEQITPGLYSDPIIMKTTSKFTFTGIGNDVPEPAMIVYDQNYALTQVNVLDPPVFVQLNTNSNFETLNSKEREGFGVQNVVFFDIQPTQQTTEGAVFFIKLTNNKFKFTGNCISVATEGSNLVKPLQEDQYRCEVDSNDPSKIKISRFELITIDQFRIQTFIKNPLTVDYSGYQIYYYQIYNNEAIGQVIAMSENTNQVLETTIISVYAPDYQVLWGFPLKGSHNQVLKSLYSSGISNPAAGGDNNYVVYNSVRNRFKLDQNSPSDTANSFYRLTWFVQNDGLLDGSIRHNLPQSGASTGVFCRDQSQPSSSVWKIVCENVGTLISDQIYYISGKIWFYQTHTYHTTNNAGFGQIRIELVTVDPITKIETIDSSLFPETVGYTLSTSNFLATDNFRGQTATYGYKNFLDNTQVVSVDDIAPSTGGDHVTLLYAKQSIKNTGIIYKKQQSAYGDAFMFFISADATKTCGSSASCSNADANYKYQQVKMEIYYNHQSLTFDKGTTEENAGIQLGAWNGVDVKQGGLCLTNTQCVNYNPSSTITGRSVLKGTDYNYKESFDTDTSNGVPAYGKYTFLCGDNSNSPTVVNAKVEFCTFDGTNKHTPSSDVDLNQILLMRHVKYTTTFTHSSLYADDSQSLDFIIAFWSGQMQCLGDPCLNSYLISLASVSVIHAYTISDVSAVISPLSLLYVAVTNYWQSNSGTQVPSILRVRGKFLADEIPADAQNLAIFFDSALKLSFINDFQSTAGSAADSFIERKSNNYPCQFKSTTKSGTQCQAIFGSKIEQTSNWRMNNGILLRDFIPIANTHFDIFVPVETGSIDPKFVTIVFLRTDGNFLTTSNVIYKKGMEGGDMINQVDTYMKILSPQTADANIAAAIARNGLDLTAPTAQIFNYGVDKSITSANNYNFKATPTDIATSTNIDFSTRGNQAGLYGGGLTIVSKGVNIFNSYNPPVLNNVDSNPEPDRTKNCVKIEYYPTYNSKKYYSAFCPFDQGVSALANTFGSTGTNIGLSIVTTDLPKTFYTDNIFTYAISEATGNGIAINQESKLVTPVSPLSCTLAVSTPTLIANQVKDQIFTLKITLGTPLKVDAKNIDGTSKILLTLTFNPNTNPPLNLGTYCAASIPSSSCTYDPATFMALITVNSGSMIASNIDLDLKLLALSNLITATSYAVDIKIGNEASGVQWVWGPDISGVTPISWESCSGGSIKMGGQLPYLNNFDLGDQVALESIVKGARSSFRIDFAPGSGRTVFPKGDYVKFDIGWVRELQETSYNCRILKYADKTISWQWDKIVFQSSQIINAYAGEDIILNSVKPDRYSFYCYNTKVPTPITGDSVGVTWMDAGGVISIQTCTKSIAPAANLLPTPPVLFFSISKNFSTAGQNARYNFEITSSNQLNFNSNIFIEFSRYIAPKLNSRDGNAECQIDSLQSFCIFENDRRIRVYIPKTLPANTQFNVKVYGITQPSQSVLIPASSPIWVAVSTNGNYNSTLNQFSTVVDMAITDINNYFGIFKASVNPNIVRTKVTHQIYATLPQNTITKGKPIYVEILSSPFARLWLPLCQVVRVEDTSAYNWVGSCNFEDSRTLRIEARETDGNITISAKDYLIEISNGPSPVQYFNNIIQDTLRYKIFIPRITDVPDTDVEYESVYFSERAEIQWKLENGVKNLGWKFYDTSGFIFPDQTYAIVNKGYHSTIIQLQSLDLLEAVQIFDQALTVTITGIDTVRFSQFPVTWDTAVDYQNPQVQIGAQFDAFSGSYFIEAFQSPKSSYDGFVNTPPTLNLLVTSQKCKLLNVSHLSVQVPKNGRSAYLKIDFSKCFPTTDITVQGQFSASSFTLEPPSITLMNNGTKQTLDISFIVVNVAASTGFVELSWELSGTDSAFFEPPPISKIYLIDDNQDPRPIGTNISYLINSITPNTQQLQVTVQCNQFGFIYYMLYKSNYPYAESFGKVRDTLKSGVLDLVRPTVNDPYGKTYGYQTIEGNTPLKVVVEIPFYDSSYNFDYYCINLNRNESSLISQKGIKIPQITSNGKLFKLTFVFNKAISDSEQVKLICLIGELIRLKELLIFSDNLNRCSNSFESKSQNFVSEISFSSEDEPKLLSDIYFIRNIRNSVDDVYTKVSTTVRADAFIPSLKKFLPEAFPQVISIRETIIIQSQIFPLTQLQSLVNDGGQITFELICNNVDGFFIVGLDQSLQTESPSMPNLLNGLNQKGNQLLFSSAVKFNKGEKKTFIFRNVPTLTEITIYYLTIPENPNMYERQYPVKSLSIFTVPLESIKDYVSRDGEYLVYKQKFGLNLQPTYLLILTIVFFIFN